MEGHLSMIKELTLDCFAGIHFDAELYGGNVLVHQNRIENQELIYLNIFSN